MAGLTQHPQLSPLLAALVLAAVSAGVLVDTADARRGKDDRPEVRVAGRCGGAATSTLKVKADDGLLEVEFEVDQNRAGVLWRIALVHERRVAWKGTARTAGPSGSFEVRRRLRDLPGRDSVTARAWGPSGLTCQAQASLTPR